LAPDGAVAGIVDWGQADAQHLAILDIAHWLLSLDLFTDRVELGGRVAARLAGRCWSPTEREWLRVAAGHCEPLSDRGVVLLTWLRHVTSNLVKSPAYTQSRVWMTRNVVPVLRQVDHE